MLIGMALRFLLGSDGGVRMPAPSRMYSSLVRLLMAIICPMAVWVSLSSFLIFPIVDLVSLAIASSLPVGVDTSEYAVVISSRRRSNFFLCFSSSNSLSNVRLSSWYSIIRVRKANFTIRATISSGTPRRCSGSSPRCEKASLGLMFVINFKCTIVLAVLICFALIQLRQVRIHLTTDQGGRGV